LKGGLIQRNCGGGRGAIRRRMALIELANPTRFLKLTRQVVPLLAALTAIGFAVGLYLTLFVAPDDYQQGATVKIMFIHVPAAWLSMACWALMTVAALGTLVWRHPLADVPAKTAAPLRAGFAFLCLATAPPCGRRMWCA